ncbi:hypothetical protein GALMADRAFT_216845 [Galerina marginata CBS 339.88]|uniref:Uncharacterized protein n=1 Tax=Galerina marginata (strain CBS 339.88) TaxID=685588 RepID=A0A067S7K2_GALM3|nr:hypothetical protein GALMADRAFT_216845 [Galerina marginata CBS 339.88]
MIESDTRELRSGIRYADRGTLGGMVIKCEVLDLPWAYLETGCTMKHAGVWRDPARRTCKITSGTRSGKAGISGVNFVYFRENTWFVNDFKRLSKSARCRAVVIVIRDGEEQGTTTFLAALAGLPAYSPACAREQACPCAARSPAPSYLGPSLVLGRLQALLPDTEPELESCTAGSELVDVDVEREEFERVVRMGKVLDADLKEAPTQARSKEHDTESIASSTSSLDA